MLVIAMAFKNLLKQKRRTLMTSIAIAVGLIFYIFIDSLLAGWYGSTEHQFINYEVASGKIVTVGWWDDKERLPLSLSIEETRKITTLLDDLAISYTPRTEFAADLIFYRNPYPEDGVYPTKVVAIDPERDARIFDLAGAIDHEYSQGAFLTAESDGVVVGNALAEKLHIEVGYPIRLQFTGKPGYEEILDTRVIGIVKTEAHLVNLHGVFISMETADEYLEMEGAVTGFSIQVPRGRRGETALRELDARLPAEYRLLGYEDIASDFMAMAEIENSFVGVMLFLVFIIAAVGVSNTMMMAIFERRREIGMLRAQGFTDRKIQVMFFLEAGGIGLVGAAVGLALGALLNIPLVRVGLNYGAMLHSDKDFVDFGGLVIDSYMKGVWSAKPFVSGGVLAVLISSFAAYFPTRRMLKQSIPDNLRMD